MSNERILKSIACALTGQLLVDTGPIVAILLEFDELQALDAADARLRCAAAQALSAPALRDLPEDLGAFCQQIQHCIAADPSRTVTSLVTGPAAC